MKKFIEIGIGNTWFVRTEIEDGQGNETETKGIHLPFTLESVYLRLWLGRKVYIIDSKGGIKRQIKPRTAFKLVLGFTGK